MTPPLPPGVSEDMAWFASWISEQFGKLEGKLDAMAKEFITRREYERLQQDIDRAHQKVREVEAGPLDEIEDRVRELERVTAVNTGSDRVRWGLVAQIGVGVSTVLLAIVLAYLGLK